MVVECSKWLFPVVAMSGWLFPLVFIVNIILESLGVY